MGLSLVAGGNINPSRFVTQSTTSDRVCTLSASGDKPIGISNPGSHLTPLLSFDDGFAAIAGEDLFVYDKDDSEAWLELGGTVTAGDFLKPDGSNTGKGITATTGNFYGARALVSGVNGQVVKVQPAFGTL